MKKTIFFIIGWALYSVVYSQTPVFNRIYESETHGFTSIVETDTGFFAINTTEFKVYALDESGNITNVKGYQDTSYLGESYNTWSSSLFTIAGTEGNCYLQASGYTKKLADTVWSAAFHLVKFDADFDTLWTRKILYTDSITPTSYLWPGAFNDCVVDSDGNIYATGGGYTGLNGGSYFNRSQLFFFKADSLGNPIELKYYVEIFINGLSNPGKKILETFDNQILIGGNKNFFYMNIEYPEAKAYIMKCNKEGDMIWDKSFNNSVLYDLIQTKDSNFLYAGIKGWGNEFWLAGKAEIVKLSPNGNVLWEKVIGGSRTSANQVRELSDGSLICTVYEEIETDSSTLFLLKLSSTGDILWKHKLASNPVAKETFTRELEIASNNGCLLSGSVRLSFANIIQHPFLIKTDSLGCDGMYSCTDTTTILHLQSWTDSVCDGDSVLISIAIANGHAPYQAIVNGIDTIAVPLYLMADSSSYFYYAHPSLANPEVLVTLTDQFGNEYSNSLVLSVVDCGNAVEMQKAERSFAVFPNPASNSIRLEILSESNEKLTVVLYNPDGNLIKKIQQFDSTSEIDVSQLPSGVYFISLTSTTHSCVQKFIKL